MTESNVTVNTLNKLEKKLDPYLSKEIQESQFFVDLADINEICTNYNVLVEKLLSCKESKEEIVDLLYEIDNEIIEHMSYHLESLKEMLPKVINEIDE